MPAPPMYRPGERIDGPLADQSAVRQYIVRLRGMTGVACENSSSAVRQYIVRLRGMTDAGC